MRSGRHFISGTSRHVVELLENRCLLAADLTPAIIGRLPGTFGPIGNHAVIVKLTNVGDTLASGSATVSVFASTDQTLDGTDVQLYSKARPVRLAHNGIAIVPAIFQTPTSVPTGTYFILADVEGDASIADANPSNNVASSTPNTVQIQQPFIDLAPSVKFLGLATTSKAGRPVVVLTQIVNNGNTFAIGQATVNVGLSTQADGSSPSALDTRVLNLRLPPHARAIVVSVKVLPLATTPDDYFATVSISAPAITQSDTINDTAVSPASHTIISAFPTVRGTAAGTATIGRSISAVALNIPTQSPADGTFSGTGTLTPPGGAPVNLTFNGTSTIFNTVTINATRDDGITTTVHGRVIGTTRLLGTFFQSDRTRGFINLTLTPAPPGPALVTGLFNDLKAVLPGQPEIAHFSVKVANADPNTTVEVDELDANGNNLGKITDLFDDGSPANADAQAGDGIFSGLNSIGLSDVGQRFFTAVVNESSQGAVGSSPAVPVTATAAPSQQQLQAAADDNTSLTNLFNSTQATGGDAAALDAVAAALATDPNVAAGSIVRTDQTVEWISAAGIPEGVSTDPLSSGDTLGGGSPVDAASAVASSGAPVATPQDATTSNGLTALLLSPYQSSLSAVDVTPAIQSMLTSAGYDCTLLANAQVTLDSFKNLGQYDTVVLYGHGTQVHSGGEAVYTNVTPGALDMLAHVGDFWNDRLEVMNNTYVIKPAYISEYSGSMDGAIINFNACNSAHDSQMANAFLGLGAGAYIGYSQTVKATFATAEATAAYQTLLQPTNNTVGDIPGINTAHDDNSPPAVFTEFGPLSATLPQPDLLKDTQLFVRYTWPQTEKDLDSNTTFLGVGAGFDLPGSQYLNWTGDDTGTGGTEITRVNLYQSWVDGAWLSTTTIDAGADWYAPAGGSGPAVLTIALENINTGKLTHVTTETINPGFESTGTTSVNASVEVTLAGDPTNPVVHIRVT